MPSNASRTERGLWAGLGVGRCAIRSTFYPGRRSHLRGLLHGPLLTEPVLCTAVLNEMGAGAPKGVLSPKLFIFLVDLGWPRRLRTTNLRLYHGPTHGKFYKMSCLSLSVSSTKHTPGPGVRGQ